jgi:hypothetical protein
MRAFAEIAVGLIAAFCRRLFRRAMMISSKITACLSVGRSHCAVCISRIKATTGISMRPNPPVETCDEQAPPAALFRRCHVALHSKSRALS